MLPRDAEFADRVALVWVKQCCSPYATLSRNVLREVAAFLLDCCLLVYINESQQLLQFNCKTRTSTLLYTFTQFTRSDFEGFTFIDSHHLIRCGGLDSPQGKEQTGAFLLDISASTLMKLPYLTIPRGYSPGLVHLSSETYAFGGLGTTDTSDLAKTGETLQEGGTSWQRLQGQMSNTRVYFCPCVFQGRIYLSGGGVSQETDVCTQHHITSLGLTLPDLNSIAVVRSKQLIFLSQHCTVVMEGATLHHKEGKFRLTTKATPVLFADKVYFRDGATIKWVQLGESLDIINWSDNLSPNIISSTS